MSRKPGALLLSLMLATFPLGYAHAWNAQFQTFRAATADDVINEMLIAGRTGRPTVIRLAAGRYVFSTRLFGSKYDSSFLPVVSTTIQIIGPDPATTTFDVDPDVFPHRFFTIVKGGNLSLFNLTLKGGAEECSLTDCSRIGGGAAYNAGGELDIHNCTLTQNVAFNASGGEIGGGGAILNLAGNLVIDRTSVIGNAAETIGGALVLLGGRASIWNSIFSSNSVGPGQGKLLVLQAAGIFVSGGARLQMTGSTVSGNVVDVSEENFTRAFGLGIYNQGTASVINSAITENGSVTHSPLDRSGPGSGGGILNGGAMSILSSTIGGNSVGTFGGGIYNVGKLILQGVTVSGNSVRGANGPIESGAGFPDGCSIEALALCVSGGGGIWNEPGGVVTVVQSALGGDAGEDCNGVLSSKGHNAIGNSLNCTLTPSPWLGGRPTHDLVNLDLRLADFQDDGEPGSAHYPLLADSPLIDAGGRVRLTCSVTDQLGQRRVEGDADRDGADICDIGAIEFQPPRHP